MQICWLIDGLRPQFWFFFGLFWDFFFFTFWTCDVLWLLLSELCPYLDALILYNKQMNFKLKFRNNPNHHGPAFLCFVPFLQRLAVGEVSRSKPRSRDTHIASFKCSVPRRFRSLVLVRFMWENRRSFSTEPSGMLAISAPRLQNSEISWDCMFWLLRHPGGWFPVHIAWKKLKCSYSQDISYFYKRKQKLYCLDGLVPRLAPRSGLFWWLSTQSQPCGLAYLVWLIFRYSDFHKP